MKMILNVVLKLVAWASLGLLTIPAFLFLAGRLSLPTVKLLMLIATVVWFACMAPSIRQD